MTIKEAIKKIFKVVEAIRKATDPDGPGGKKVTLIESLGITLQGIGLVSAFTAFDQLKNDWISRDAAKKKEWSDAFAEEFDIKDDDLEQQIEEIVAAILGIENVFAKFFN